MKYLLTVGLLIFTIILSLAQLCPATNSTFSTAVLFDPNWILGCNSGTSCVGGTTFDNRTACEAIGYMGVLQSLLKEQEHFAFADQ